MARSKHATYTAADRHERRHAARNRRYNRHAQAQILRAEMAVAR